MIAILKPESRKEDIDNLIESLESNNVRVKPVNKSNSGALALIGDTKKIDTYRLEGSDIVEKIMHIKEPFKRSNRLVNPEDSIINVSGQTIGGKKIALIAGPCSVENEEQISSIAREVKNGGANFLRGGAFKPRTSPYTFQGLGTEGLELLKLARRQTGLPIVTELMSAKHIDKFVEDVDIIQVGSRNMQNFDLLKELGKIDKPILLKRGLSATIEEFLMAAEYVMAGGNEKVILCERGIRTFETYTRNTLDLSAIPAIKKLSHLPILVDPSHASGKAWMVDSLSKAAIVAGADGLIIEVHNNPEQAITDGHQSITPSSYKKLVGDLRVLAKAVGREI